MGHSGVRRPVGVGSGGSVAPDREGASVVDHTDGGTDMFELTGKVALVTGAGQNVGAGIARVLAAQGATVVVNDIRVERADETVAAIRAAGGTATSVGFDVTDYDDVVAGIGAGRRRGRARSTSS